MTIAPFLGDRLAEQEAVIERGLDTFLAVGQALLAIRDERLYTHAHATFEDYCRERWAISRSRAYQLMSAAQVSESMSTFVDASVPSTEAQARSLVGLTPGQAVETMQVARAAAALTRGSTEPTARELTETRAHLFGPHQVSQTPSSTIPQGEPVSRDVGDGHAPPMTAAQINAISPPDLIAKAKDEADRAMPAYGIAHAIEHLLSKGDPETAVRDCPPNDRDQFARVGEAITYLTAITNALETYR